MSDPGKGDLRVLSELRTRIDAIDAEMHRLLIARGTVIDALIKTKGTGRPGAAFRPAREADMMRSIVKRHEGALPLTTVEHIWREIITTFTRMQAPFDVAIDVSVEPERMRDLARFVFGFSVSLTPMAKAEAVVAAVAGANSLGLIARAAKGAWWLGLVGKGAPRITALLPFIESPGRPADLPAFVISPPLADPTPMDIGAFAVTVGNRMKDIEGTKILAAAGNEFLVAAPTSLPPGGLSRELSEAGVSVVSVPPVGAFARGITISGRATFLYEAHELSEAKRPIPRPGVLDIAPYVPGRARATGGAKHHKLSSNETPLGPSPAAIAAYRAMADSLERYPDGSATALRNAIGAAYGLNPERIVCGSGSDEILNLIAHAYIGPGDEAVYSEHGFLVYPLATKAAGGTPVAAPERNLTADVDAILAKVTARTRVVFLANPNNPTGTYLPFREVRRLHAGLPPRVLLVLDAAYAEYVRRNDYESGIELAGTAENVVMTRTFSKIYGLAGLRIGWGYGPAHVIDALNRIRGPFNVSSPAIAAGVAALGDRAHREQAAAHNDEWLPKLSAAVAGLGLTVTPSVANFILIGFPDVAGRRAADADAYLLDRGVVLRRMEAYGLPNALRMTIGSAEANEATVAALAAFMGKGKS